GRCHNAKALTNLRQLHAAAEFLRSSRCHGNCTPGWEDAGDGGSGRSRGNYLDRQEVRMSLGPGERLIFGLKEAVDYDRVTFVRSSARQPRRLSISNRSAGVDGCERGSIWQYDIAAVRNPRRIHGAMAVAQAQTSRG